MGMSDQKDAVQIGVTLSSQIISASLAMIAVIGAFATFVLDKREVGNFYYALIFGAFLCFVLSIYFGGKGINRARIDGFEGLWEISVTKKFFNLQATILLVGVILFIISTFTGTEKETNQKFNSELSKINELQRKDSLNTIEIFKLKEEISKLEMEIKEIKNNEVELDKK